MSAQRSRTDVSVWLSVHIVVSATSTLTSTHVPVNVEILIDCTQRVSLDCFSPSSLGSAFASGWKRHHRGLPGVSRPARPVCVQI
ncbi:MAG: hypothetical protein ACOX5R_02115 [bacterium]